MVPRLRLRLRSLSGAVRSQPYCQPRPVRSQQHGRLALGGQRRALAQLHVFVQNLSDSSEALAERGDLRCLGVAYLRPHVTPPAVCDADDCGSVSAAPSHAATPVCPYWGHLVCGCSQPVLTLNDACTLAASLTALGEALP